MTAYAMANAKASRMTNTPFAEPIFKPPSPSGEEWYMLRTS